MKRIDDKDLELSVAYALRDLNPWPPKDDGRKDPPALIYARKVVAYFRLCGWRVVHDDVPVGGK